MEKTCRDELIISIEWVQRTDYIPFESGNKDCFEGDQV